MDTPPPPPPHGTNPKTANPNLPPGKYDIFIIPPHSSGSGFLYLPSLQPNINSFAAGFASALVLVVLSQSMAPAFRSWWANFQGMGDAGMVILVIAVGVGAWALGRIQHDKNTGNGGKNGSNSGPGAGAPSPPPPEPAKPAPPKEAPRPPTPPPEPPKPPPQEPPKPEPPKVALPKPEPPKAEAPKPEPPKPEPPKPEPEPPKPDPPKADPPKEKPKGAWEKAREETRRREEERKAKEAEQRRKDEVQRRLKELREKEARERAKQQREKEQKEKELKEKLQREREVRDARLAEARERELRERLEREKALRERLEREAKEREEARLQEQKAKEETVRKSTYAFSSVGEKTNPWPNGKPPVQAQPAPAQAPPSPARPNPTPASAKRPPPPPSARTYDDDATSSYSYRPYDQPKAHNRRRSGETVFTESSYAASQSTARSTPPPSMRRPYTTKDPDKIVIKAVYSFLNQFSKTPASQLISGFGPVTDGLILRITTEGIFIDDDVRGVPQREWDVKAWTLKTMEIWCPSAAEVTSAKPTQKSASRWRTTTRGPSRVLGGEDADAFLTELLHVCRDECRLELHEGYERRSANGSSSGKWEHRGLHVLQATIRDQEGKRYMFVLDEGEGWKVAVALQRLRKGTQARQLGIQPTTAAEARATLELLGW
ncbi:uncharacterized protein B0I36DRAFT_237465 [Microdochium trichocladiopsis]|uniref:Uncharacterized protein n=1 Tax=Microdochium trichocladiopsis TaxID=1682393 RepID=A0A9P8YEU9_9PEZI|nr:uncharacterized protein B0I36DRAFT_237465 [Microdochium trichocladiopsis]KAH7038028.1 hypothetical protein B0I36DRAFT_237465 [Microdochium trichocladiopsis]